MNIKLIKYTVLIILTASAQTTILSHIEVGSIKPNLLLVIIIAFSLLGTRAETAFIGYFCGLLQDIMSGKLFGLYALLGMYLGLAINYMQFKSSSIFNIGRFNTLIMVMFMSTFIYESLVCIISMGFSSIYATLSLTGKMFIEAIYNCIICIIIYFLVQTSSKSPNQLA